MSRQPLQPGQIGTPSIRKVSQKPGTRTWVKDPQGTHWQGQVRVGRWNQPPLLIRAIAETRREAEQQIVEQATQAAQQHAYQPGTLSPNSSFLDIWEAYKQSDHWKGLARGTQEQHNVCIRQVSQEHSQWVASPIEKALTKQTLQQLLETYADKHGEGQAAQLKRSISTAVRLIDDQINTDALRKVILPKRPLINEAAKKHQKERVFTIQELQHIESVISPKIQSGVATWGEIAIFINSYLGVRAKDFHSLTWGQVDLGSGEIRAYSMKTQREYPPKILPPKFIPALQLLHTRNTGERLIPVGHSRFLHQVRDAFDSLGYEWATFHTLRRTAGSLVFDRYGARAAADWLAHRNITLVMQVYAKTQGAAPAGPVALW